MNNYKNNLLHDIKNKKVIILLGSGGVGKTTLSASVALLAASLNKKVLVITIDPAKRLVNALGLSGLPYKPTKISLKVKGSLYVMMLDMETAWHDLISRLSSSDKIKNDILKNRFFRYLSRDLSGSQEFISCEALYYLIVNNSFDLIVLDTPPTVQALNFLDAPTKVLSFLSQDKIKRFLKKRKQSFFLSNFMKFTNKFFYSIIIRVIGKEFLEDFLFFLKIINNIYDPIIQRTNNFQKFIQSKEVSFVIITSAKETALLEAKGLYNSLLLRNFCFSLFIINKVLKKSSKSLQKLNKKDILCLFQKKNPLFTVQNAYNFYKVIKEHKGLEKNQNQILKNFFLKLKIKVPFVKIPIISKDINSIDSILKIIPNLTNNKQ